MSHQYAEIKKVKNKGRALFAKKNIKKDSLIEESPAILFPKEEYKLMSKNNFFLLNYIFIDLNKNKDCGIPLGLGSLFNHSYEPNIECFYDAKRNVFYFCAIKKIDKGQELTLNYNGEVSCQEKVYFIKSK